MILQAGELIARLDLDDPSAVRKAEPFHGSFPLLGPPTAISGKVHQRCAASLNAARMILAGYEHNIDEVGVFLSIIYLRRKFTDFGRISIFNSVILGHVAMYTKNTLNAISHNSFIKLISISGSSKLAELPGQS